MNRPVILFGAGAEVPFKMPLGGEFALQVVSSGMNNEIWDAIVNDINTTRTAVMTGIQQEKLGWEAYKKWLGDLLDGGIVRRGPSTQELKEIFRSTVSENRQKILRIIASVDVTLQDAGYADTAFVAAQSVPLQAEVPAAFGNVMEPLNQSELIAQITGWALNANNGLAEPVWHLLRMFIELAYAAGGQEAVRQLRGAKFGNPAVVQHVGVNLDGIVQIDFGTLGIDALNYAVDLSNKEEADEIAEFCFRVIRRVVSDIIDYQVLIEKYLPALYRPEAAGKARVLKAMRLIHGIKETIATKYSETKKYQDLPSYYLDLATSGSLSGLQLATTNYTNHIVDVTGVSSDDVLWLNGHVAERLDPYHNMVTHEAAIPPGRLTVPHLVAQSVIKPMMTPHTINVYQKFAAPMLNAPCIAVVGYGFGAVDSHINALIRTRLLRDDGGPLVVFVHHSEVPRNVSSVDRPGYAREEVMSRLRLFDDPGGRLQVRVLEDDRKSEGRNWLEYVQDYTRD
jgi:hypothetical protein